MNSQRRSTLHWTKTLHSNAIQNEKFVQVFITQDFFEATSKTFSLVAVILQLSSLLLDPIEEPVQGFLQAWHVADVDVEDGPRPSDRVQAEVLRKVGQAFRVPGSDRSVGATNNQKWSVSLASRLHPCQHDLKLSLPQRVLEMEKISWHDICHFYRWL